MASIEPKDKTLKTLEGLHLWHAPMSSCSQRVRIVLSELKLDYKSHLVNLEKNEHATEAYQNIHPKGLVPALVDDGELIIESIDIISHIAGTESELSQTSGSGLLQMADDAQLDLKLLTFEFLFRMAPPPPADSANAFQQDHNNEWLKQFRRDFANGFDANRIDEAIARTATGFDQLEQRLSDGRTWLSGNTFTLDDIAWMPNVHRFRLMDWPFELTPSLNAWFKRVSKRESYGVGLLNWQKTELAHSFAEYTQKRKAEGTDIRSFPYLVNKLVAN